VEIHHGYGAENQQSAVSTTSYLLLPTWHAKYRSGFMTLSPKPLQEQLTVVLLWERFLASWLLAIGECGGHDNLCGSGHLSVIPYVHGRTELYCAQACLA
jgi:hypothetical protein